MSSSSWFLVQLTFEVASRFYDQLFAHNSSDWQNLTCARLKPDTRTADFPEWDISHGTCRTEWDARGLTCVCKQPGTYALLWSKKGEEVSERERKIVKGLSSIKREESCTYYRILLTVSLQGWVLCALGNSEDVSLCRRRLFFALMLSLLFVSFWQRLTLSDQRAHHGDALWVREKPATKK